MSGRAGSDRARLTELASASGLSRRCFLGRAGDVGFALGLGADVGFALSMARKPMLVFGLGPKPTFFCCGLPDVGF